MTDDERLIADLLGEAPAAPDPGFRYDVFARVAQSGRREASLRRAARSFGTMTAIGLGCAVIQASGLTWETAQPILVAAVSLGAAFLFAAISIQGPRAVLARAGSLRIAA